MTGERYPCPVCAHPSRAAIDQALVNGKSMRGLARDFDLGDHKKIARHRDKCMAEAYQTARKESVEVAGNALSRRLDELDAVVDESLGRLRAGKKVIRDDLPVLLDDGTHLMYYDEPGLMRTIREARRNLDTRMRLAGIGADGDESEVAAARAGLEDPEMRRLAIEWEKRLAETSDMPARSGE